MDWSGCELVETVSGVAVVKGTRVPVDGPFRLFESHSKVAEIAAAYPTVPLDRLEGVLTYAAERMGMDTVTLVDWRGCELVEQVPGRCSGAPTIVGTRIFPDTIAEYYWSGTSVQEILDDYPSLTEDMVRRLIEHVKSNGSRAA
jgi:uncharacterized protein (DUF433 family)